MYTIKKSDMELVISPIGATILSCKYKGKDLLKQNKNPGKDSTFPNAILVPFANRIEDGAYSYEDDDYQLPINEEDRENALHGLVFDKEFEVVDQGDDFISFRFDPSHADFEGYPFDFTFEILYTLNSKGLELTTNFTNNTTHEVPYSMGWHPYFIPLDHELIDECNLQIGFEKVVLNKLERELIPNGEFDEYNFDGLLGDTVFDTAFWTEDKANIKNTFFEKFNIYQDSSMHSLQIFTPNDRKSIAIEPQTTIPDAFNNKIGLNIIEPGETQTNVFGFNIEI